MTSFAFSFAFAEETRQLSPRDVLATHYKPDERRTFVYLHGHGEPRSVRDDFNAIEKRTRLPFIALDPLADGSILRVRSGAADFVLDQPARHSFLSALRLREHTLDVPLKASHISVSLGMAGFSAFALQDERPRSLFNREASLHSDIVFLRPDFDLGKAEVRPFNAGGGKTENHPVISLPDREGFPPVRIGVEQSLPEMAERLLISLGTHVSQHGWEAVETNRTQVLSSLLRFVGQDARKKATKLFPSLGL